MKLELLSYHIETNNLACINNLNTRAKSRKLLEESIRMHLHDLIFGNGILDLTKSMNNKRKKTKDKLGFIKFKNLCASKDFSRK